MDSSGAAPAPVVMDLEAAAAVVVAAVIVVRHGGAEAPRSSQCESCRALVVHDALSFFSQLLVLHGVLLILNDCFLVAASLSQRAGAL